jgi:proteasome lid subunit RPN8/RPN11
VNGDSVRIARGLLAELTDRARRALPRECCGLLVGTPSRIDACVATANVDPHPSRYRVDPAAHIELNRRLRGSGRAVMGVYHSHPRGPAVPSQRDIAEAFYPEFVHLIVVVTPEGVGEIRAYRIEGGAVRELTMAEDSGQAS